MAEGIKLQFDDDDQATVKKQRKEKMCFGGVMCPHMEYKEKIMWCEAADKPVSDFDKHCPQNRWVTLVVPIGHQNMFQPKNYKLREFKPGRCYWTKK